ANTHVRLVANAKNWVATASAMRPPTIGALRPLRSDNAPAGIDTVTSVTPNDANTSPIIVGDAPNRRLKSGSTGIATAYATMSVKVAKVTSAAATDRDVRNDILQRQYITKARRS